jgi:hypothetical protein
MLIALDGVSAPITLSNCDALLRPLAEVLGSWRFRILETTERDSDAAPAISVRREGDCFRITSPWLGQAVMERSAVGAIFSLTAELAQAFAAEKPERLCFHCAAVEIGGRLIMFPNTEDAGKSTLVAKLASSGFRIFADDVLPISETSRSGMSLGVAPRLRLPLPPTADTAFREFVRTHRGPHDKEFAYLALPENLLAPYGALAPIGAVLVLDRRGSASAQLASVPRAQGLRQLIEQNFAPGGTRINAVDRLYGLIEPTPCFSLIYSDLDEATKLIRTRFSKNSASWRKASKAPWTEAAEVAVEVPPERIRAHVPRFEQTPGVILRAVDDDLFLVQPDQEVVFHLNPVAASLWRLLDRPTTMAAAIDTLSQVFPLADARRVKRDVRTLFDTLRAGGLIRFSPGQ